MKRRDLSYYTQIPWLIITDSFTIDDVSREAFTRAFQAEYGKNPSVFKRIQEHRVFARLDISNPDFRLEYTKGDIRYEPVTRNEIYITGKKYRTSMKNHQNQVDVPNAWQDGIISMAHGCP